MKEEIIRLSEFDITKHELAGMPFTTVRRKGRGNALFSPSTYEHNKFTRYAYGHSNPLTLDQLINLSKTLPKAYVNFLVDDAVSHTWVQVRNIRLIVYKKVK